MKFHRLLFLGFAASIGLAFMASSCQRRSTPVSTDVIAREYAKGLDLQAVTNLARTSKNPEEFEKKLNDRTTGVNNIDLNDDGKVDYIKVTEFGEGTERGYSLTTELAPGEEQEIATILFRKSGDRIDAQATGHPSLYGSNHYYRSSFGLTDVLLWSYILSDRGGYRSPYGYGNYPPTYGGGWSRQPDQSYTATSSRYRSMSPANSPGAKPLSPTVQSPNADKKAARARMIANPSQAQRSFATRTGRPVSSGGFGRSSSGGSSSRSSFGGGK